MAINILYAQLVVEGRLKWQFCLKIKGEGKKPRFGIKIYMLGTSRKNILYLHVAYREAEEWKGERLMRGDFFFFFAFSIIYVNYYLDAWYVLKEKLWWINKQLSKSSIGCFTLQGILSLAFDTISAAGKEFQSSECWSIARHSKAPCRARQTKKSLWTCRIKSPLPLSATPAWAGKLCPHFLGSSMINKWSLEHLYSLQPCN